MGYKKMKKNLGFADFALANSLKHNRSLKLMDKLNSSLELGQNPIRLNEPLHCRHQR